MHTSVIFTCTKERQKKKKKQIQYLYSDKQTDLELKIISFEPNE